MTMASLWSMFCSPVYEGYSALNVAQWNLGGQGALTLALWRKLDLPISNMLKQGCNAIDKACCTAQARQSSHKYKRQDLGKTALHTWII